MKHIRLIPTAALTLGMALALSACGKKEDSNVESTAPTAPPVAEQPASTPPAANEAVAVASIDLGKAVGGDQKVTTATTSFSPKDPIYAAVSTTGAGTATIGAKWTFQDGQTVKEDSKSIAPTGPATTSFEISKPDGWPVGSYKVEISLNGQSAGSKDFSVQ